jgi:hypothetical protein
LARTALLASGVDSEHRATSRIIADLTRTASSELIPPSVRNVFSEVALRFLRTC